MITILCVGKKPEVIYEPAVAHFETRIKPYTKFAWHILPHSSQDEQAASADESTRLFAKISSGDYVILLDENGASLSSPQISEHIEKAQNTARNIVFIIGGAYGVDENIKQRADTVIAFGKAVFPHQLMRVMLLEQIYRAHSILAGSKYHHT